MLKTFAMFQSVLSLRILFILAPRTILRGVILWPLSSLVYTDRVDRASIWDLRVGRVASVRSRWTLVIRLRRNGVRCSERYSGWPWPIIRVSVIVGPWGPRALIPLVACRVIGSILSRVVVWGWISVEASLWSGVLSVITRVLNRTTLVSFRVRPGIIKGILVLFLFKDLAYPYSEVGQGRVFHRELHSILFI